MEFGIAIINYRCNRMAAVLQNKEFYFITNENEHDEGEYVLIRFSKDDQFCQIVPLDKITLKN